MISILQTMLVVQHIRTQTLVSTYRPPSGYSYGSSNTQALLAGSFTFTPSEVEVFYFV